MELVQTRSFEVTTFLSIPFLYHNEQEGRGGIIFLMFGRNFRGGDTSDSGGHWLCSHGQEPNEISKFLSHTETARSFRQSIVPIVSRFQP